MTRFKITDELQLSDGSLDSAFPGISLTWLLFPQIIVPESTIPLDFYMDGVGRAFSYSS